MEVVADPCNPSPCGANAVCSAGICTCLPEYQGDPYRGCRPECIVSTDCPRDKACIRSKCLDPCPNTCGPNTLCTVVNHVPMCTCIEGYDGNAFIGCNKLPGSSVFNTPFIDFTEHFISEIPQTPCLPSPCGPNSQCRQINGQAVCSCVPGFVGSPPTCRPECIISAECNQNRACVNQKCIDPCPGTCGIGANCQVVNHNPICSCPVQYTGDPFTRCQLIRKTLSFKENVISDFKRILEAIEVVAPTNPCQPSPCGPNSECRVTGDSPACSCLPEFIGSPPNCRPECVGNSECPEHLACINRKCKDPCPGSCGSNAECRVISHTPNCICLIGFTGDPFSQCVIQLQPVPEDLRNPCIPSPCGANAECRTQNNAGSCRCLPDYIGDPYSGCRPECVVNSDCPYNKACIQNKCASPCPGTCGANAECQVIDHLPSCTCRPGYTGDPFNYCNLIPEKSNHPYSKTNIYNPYTSFSCPSETSKPLFPFALWT